VFKLTKKWIGMIGEVHELLKEIDDDGAWTVKWDSFEYAKNAGALIKLSDTMKEYCETHATFLKFVNSISTIEVVLQFIDILVSDVILNIVKSDMIKDTWK
jgi:hypothetical protein